MKKFFSRKFITILSMLVMLLGSVFFQSINTVMAKDVSIPVNGLSSKDATILNSQGQQVSPSQIKRDGWTGYNVKYNWSIGDDINISSGDVANVYLPNGMTVN